MLRISNGLQSSSFPRLTWVALTTGCNRAPLLECVVAALLLGLAIAMRVVNLRDYGLQLQPGDEGIRGSQLLLMQAGYRPFREIYASQGPLLLDLLYPLFQAFGGTLLAARLAVAAYSLVGLAGAYWVGRQVAGPVGAAATALVLLLSPTYLQNSRQALAEVVALGPAVLALGAALAYQRSGRPAWLLAAAGLLGLSLLIKPITLGVAPAVVLAIVLAPRRPPRRAFIALGLVTLGVIAAGVLAVGLEGVGEQIVAYRLQTREAIDWRPEQNWASLVTFVSPEQLALFCLAALGLVLLVRSSPAQGIPLAAWAAAALLLLLLYSPLFPKHAATLLPPLAILAGAAGGRLWQVGRGQTSRRGPARIGLLAALALYLWALPGVIAADLSRLHWGAESPAGFAGTGDAVRTMTLLTDQGDFLLTDYPLFAILARRLVPPPLVDASETRVRATGLTGAEVAEQATRFPAQAAILRSRRFHALPGFGAWLDREFQLVKIYDSRSEPEAARFIYLRRDADLERARLTLTSGFVATPGLEFGGQLQLLAYRLSDARLARGGVTALSLEWQASQRFSHPYRVRAQLSGPDGKLWVNNTLGFGDWSDDNPVWQPGRWVVMVWPVRVPLEAPAGEYRIAIGIDDESRRAAVPITSRQPDYAVLDGERIVLATVEVR